MDFLSELESICGSENQLLLKKIMIGIVRESRVQKSNCSDSLAMLWGQCDSSVSCQFALAQYYTFKSQDSSVLIGE